MGRKKCKHGDASGRYSNGACKLCASIRALSWNKGNVTRRKEINAKYISLNKQKHKEFRDKNREILLEKKRKYNLINKEKINKANAEYKKKNKPIINACNSSRRAVIRGAKGSFNRSDIDDLLIHQNGKCAYCFINMQEYHIDHIMPVSLGGDNDKYNIQLLCPSCNLKKGAKHPNDYIYEKGNLL